MTIESAGASVIPLHSATGVPSSGEGTLAEPASSTPSSGGAVHPPDTQERITYVAPAQQAEAALTWLDIAGTLQAIPPFRPISTLSEANPCGARTPHEDLFRVRPGLPARPG